MLNGKYFLKNKEAQKVIYVLITAIRVNKSNNELILKKERGCYK